MVQVRLFAVVIYAVFVGLFSLLATTAFAGPQEPTCKQAFGEVACGYECLAAFGQVRCANTPWGTCKAAFGKVVCSDGRYDLAGRSSVPKATCTAAFGEVACGWSCKAAFGDLRCASTPEGTCTAAHGEVTCWDPPPGLAPRPNRARADAARPATNATPTSWPEPTCTTAYGKTACGYACKAAFGEVACANTPAGVCSAAHGKVVCWDPPPSQVR